MRVQALNYTPAVEVGDELVYRVQHYREYLDEEEITYVKYNITCVEDVLETTIVNASQYNSEDNLNYTFVQNRTIGTLQDYSLVLYSLYGAIIIIPGTKIADYISNYEYFWPHDSITSIKRGYGVKIESQFYWREYEYNKNGIEVRITIHDPHPLGGYQDLEWILYSINGELYDYKSVPGYSVPLIVGFSVLGLISLFVWVKQKERKPKK